MKESLSPGHRFRPERVSEATIKRAKFKNIGLYEEINGDCAIYKWDRSCGFASLLLKDFGNIFEVWEISNEGVKRLFRGVIKFKRELEYFKELL